MYNLDLKTKAIERLRQCMRHEQAAYRDYLLTLPPRCRADYLGQYLLREHIIASTCPEHLTDPIGIYLYNDQLTALLRCPNPLSKIAREYRLGALYGTVPAGETELFLSAGHAIEHCANDLLRREFLARKAVGDNTKPDYTKELEDLLD